jgi:large subunit ribosomal protein L17
MRHNSANRKLGRTTSHRKAMLSNMVVSLITHERIHTTQQKAREVRRVAEQVITLGKDNTIHARQLAFAILKDKSVVKKVFDVLGPRFATRPGGYTRVLKTGFRHGDNASMTILELVERSAKEEVAPEPEKAETKDAAKAE